MNSRSCSRIAKKGRLTGPRKEEGLGAPGDEKRRRAECEKEKGEKEREKLQTRLRVRSSIPKKGNATHNARGFTLMYCPEVSEKEKGPKERRENKNGRRREEGENRGEKYL